MSSKTNVQRIDAGNAIPFLQQNHMWGATKARYYYGLYLPSSEDGGTDDQLVAVATFSTKRTILNGSSSTIKSRSVELLRFCTLVNCTVVGGITKLIRAFINEQNESSNPVDYIVTVVDRDWGGGEQWHSIGFDTLHVMNPLFMVVKDGVRRHLVGAGVANQKTKGKSLGRLGVDEHLLEQLEGATNHEEALNCLVRNGYYPVYDAGVERLIMAEAEGSLDVLKMKNIVPSYGASYSSKNAGISLLLSNTVASSSMYGRPMLPASTKVSNIEGKAKINDSMEAQDHVAAWRAGGISNTTLLYQSPSSLDHSATVEIRQRAGGWCTLGMVGGACKSIRHGSFKLDDGEDVSPALVSEYLRTMVATSLTALEFQRIHPDNDGNDKDSNDTKAELSCLYLGFGAGSLARFMSTLCGFSNHVAIELDEGVVSAAYDFGLLGGSKEAKIRLQSGDALTFYHPPNEHPFDIVFVDVFDGDNLLPIEFYTKQYLEHIQQNYLGGRESGIVIHNFHTGGKKRGAILEEAIKSYRSVFKTTYTVESLDSYPNGGNTILVCMNKRRLDASSETLSWYMAGRKAQQRWGINFDIFARATHKLWLT